MYAKAAALAPTNWGQIEQQFLEAMEGFDANVCAGIATQGDWQNGKGDFLNDLFALLLEGCAELTLYSRGRVPGFIFERHNLDVTYPNEGVVKFTLESKATGAPRHPGNEKSQAKSPLGRRGGADLDKRVKEGAFKVIDLKAEYSHIMAKAGEAPSAGGPGGNLTPWLRKQRPSAYLFVATRVISDNDLAGVVRQAEMATQLYDHVGLYCFQPIGFDAANATKYEAVKESKIPTHLRLERVLHEACVELTELKAEQPMPYPQGGAP